MNRPWMPLYIADYRADTAHLSACQHGAYLLLIMHYWQTGGLPKEDAPLSRIACMSPAEWRRARPIIAPFFGDDWASHKRIDIEIARAADISTKRKAAVEQREIKRRSIDDHMMTQPQPHLPREERLDSSGGKRNGWSPPKHGARHQLKGLVYIREGTSEWTSHAADFAAVHFEDPKPDKGGGYWFKMKGEAAA